MINAGDRALEVVTQRIEALRSANGIDLLTSRQTSV